MPRGVVISDLHLFAKRSRGSRRFDELRSGLRDVDLVVLNGDTFDFRWSTLESHAATESAALEWLGAVVRDHPSCDVHFVLGNHDCLHSFRDRLAGLAESLARLHVHERCVRLGTSLFLHGDCTHRRMDASGLADYRRSWEHDRQRSSLGAAMYELSDRLGLTDLVHRMHFPRERTVRRIAHYLDHVLPDWRESIRDCYFGHTHLSFADYIHEGVAFHNTGSGIRNMSFAPRYFEVDR